MKGLISEREVFKGALYDMGSNSYIKHYRYRKGSEYSKLYAIASGCHNANSQEFQKGFLIDKAGELQKQNGYVSLSADGMALEWADSKNDMIKSGERLEIVPFM